MTAVFTGFQPERASPESLARQIQRHVRGLILTGTLPAGGPLPPSRRFARELGVSRNAIVEAYAALAAEGFVEGRVGDGTFVSAGMAILPAGPPAAQPPPPPPLEQLPHRFDIIDFKARVPDTRKFPVEAWRQLTRQLWKEITPLDLAYSEPEGRVELRREIASFLRVHRGISCHPEQILVTCGASHAISVVSRILFRGGRKTCLMEDPGAPEAHRAISAAGGRIEPAPTDEGGMVTDALPANARPAFLYVSPSHHYPLGVTMSLQRRIRLLEYAGRKDTFVVENDTDAALSHGAPSPVALHGMDPGRVVHLGAFSTTLFPSLAIGYVVLPQQLIATGREIKWSEDQPNAAVEELILARFLSLGAYDRYVRGMRRVYREARRLLLEALHLHFGPSVEVLGEGLGLHLCARFAGVKFTAKVLNRIDLAGVGVYSVEECAIRKGQWEDALVLGYGMLDTRRINTGIAILKRSMPSRSPPRCTPVKGC